MGGFSIANKLTNLFKRRTKEQRKNVEMLRIKLNEVEYYVRRRTATTQLKTLKNRSREVRELARNESLVVYQVDRPGGGSATFELCFEIDQFGLEFGLLLTTSQVIAQRELKSNAMAILNVFVPYLVEQGKEKVFKNIADLLECYRDNPTWSMAHFAAYFAWKSYFVDLPLETLEDTDNQDQVSTLHVAVMGGDEEVVSELVRTGMNVFIVDSIRHWTVMHYAVIGNNATMVGKLASMPAFYEQLSHVDVKGRTPIHIAFLRGYVFSIQRLMMQGLTSKMLTVTQPKPPNHPLEMYQDYSRCVRFSAKEVTEDFDLTAFEYGGCPLHWADKFDLLDRLLGLRAFKVNLRNAKGDTPLITFIKRLDHEQHNNQQGRHSSSKSTSSLSLTSNRALDQLADDRLCWLLRLITAGGRINGQNREGNTALHYAVANADVASVMMLIIFGARKNLTNHFGESAFHLASIRLAYFKSLSSRVIVAKREEIKQSYQTIVDLLIECHARKCAKTMSSKCGVECASHKNNKARQERKVRKSETNNLKIEDLFEICLCERDQERQTNGTENQVKVEKNEDMDKVMPVKEATEEVKPSVEVTTKDDLELTIASRSDSGTSLDKDDSNMSVLSLTDDSDTDELTNKRTKSTKSIKVTKKSSEPSSSPNVIEVSAQTEPTVQPQENLIKQPEQRNITPPAPALSSMIVFDGGFSERGIKPLIQAFILNEISLRLDHPLADYFDIMAGSSYGSTMGAMIAVGQNPMETFLFFLRLREKFKNPMMQNRDANGAKVEQNLKRMFGSSKSLCDVAKVDGKHLMMMTTLMNRNPIRLRVLHSFGSQSAYEKIGLGRTSADQRMMPVWKACRASGIGLANYNAFGEYYDGSLLSANPTLDALSHYQSVRDVLAHANQVNQDIIKDDGSLQPLGLVLSVGSGSPPTKLNVPIIDTNQFSFNLLRMNMNIQYLNYLRGIMLESIIQVDGFETERAKWWCHSTNTSYARVNFTINTVADNNKKKSHRSQVTAGTFRSKPTTPVRNKNATDSLLHILWNVKIQMVENGHKFRRLTKVLEHHYQLRHKAN